MLIYILVYLYCVWGTVNSNVSESINLIETKICLFGYLESFYKELFIDDNLLFKWFTNCWYFEKADLVFWFDFKNFIKIGQRNVGAPSKWTLL